MDDLVKLVSQKANISEAQAKVAVETVVSFIKQKLPPALAAQVDNALAGNLPGDLAKGLGGILGGKK